MNLTREQYRYFLKDAVRLTIDFNETDQSRGVDPPPFQKPVPAGGKRIDLVPVHDWKGVRNLDLTAAFAGRASVRQFLREPLTLDELSYLLWATQGIRSVASASTAFRTVPSAALGYVFGKTVSVSNVPTGERATLVMRVFDGSSWENATCRGESNPITIQLLGSIGTGLPIANLVGLQPFQVDCVPEPGTLTLLGFAAGGSCLLRWMKRSN
jgi:hypothetical protein